MGKSTRNRNFHQLFEFTREYFLEGGLLQPGTTESHHLKCGPSNRLILAKWSPWEVKVGEFGSTALGISWQSWQIWSGNVWDALETIKQSQIVNGWLASKKQVEVMGEVYVGPRHRNPIFVVGLPYGTMLIISKMYHRSPGGTTHMVTPLMWFKQCHKPSPSYHRFHGWDTPSKMGWFMTLFYPHQ